MPPEPTPRAIALYQHDPPGEVPHVDLFLAPENPAFGDDDRVLSSWRLPCDPRTMVQETWVDIVTTSPHRGRYLHIRTARQLDGNRGLLTPLSHGEAAVRSISPGIRSLEIQWSDGTRLELELDCGEDRTRLRRLDAARPPENPR